MLDIVVKTTVRTYYSDLHCEYNRFRDRTRETAMGTFAPSPIQFLYRAFEDLITKGVVDVGKRAIDMGSGDGRIVAMLASLGWHAEGIEYDGKLVAESRQHMRQLVQQNAFSNAPEIHQGDFSEGDIGDQPFAEYGLVFNYLSNEKAAARRVTHESPPGTVFLLAHETHLEQFNGLERIALHRMDDFFDFKDVPWQDRSFHLQTFVKP